MSERLEKLESRLSKQHHKDLFLQTKHTLEVIDNLAEQHRLFTSMQAISGVKIIGGEEQLFYETLNQVKERIVTILEKTLEDLEHKGVKQYTKNFTDGVE
ncbi:hypothetical protein [Paenibacillus protaetiae]|uniref:Uncharacterized protein n=1 Tax=Paenibacillus protaetiae TaxID=2509456 RepID=A0A4V0YEQ8_9BACL|nr:hypothetical protein [Paenibacillus protaetiae]QAY65061.1 hypothetical protein ET464_00325 [Paenibacillus protaetiae]